MATTPVFLPGKSHGQRSLVGHSPLGCKRVGHNLAANRELAYALYMPVGTLTLAQL